MTDWITEALKLLGAFLAAAATVVVAGIVRKGTLAETLRKEQQDIREWLKAQLVEVRKEHEVCNERLTEMESTMRSVALILRRALRLREEGLPDDVELSAALLRLEQKRD